MPGTERRKAVGIELEEEALTLKTVGQFVDYVERKIGAGR
jgi:hypothetical protein